MRIAQVAPLYESVPPTGYGGTERVVHNLTEELVRQGHEVTLFASGDSLSSAHLVSTCERALRLDAESKLPHFPHLLQLDRVIARAGEFDVIHFHTEPYHFPLLPFLKTATLSTLHGRLDLKEYPPFFHHFATEPLVSISDHQRLPLPWANWAATVYHGLPLDLYSLNHQPGDHVVFLGRISPEKRVDRAIEIARRAGLNIKIAAKIDPNERAYFEREIAPLFELPHVEYIGEIGESVKQEFLGQAKAMLFPIDWPEPFGMVMIEAMACGTPVIAYRNGSVPEIICNGINGYVVENEVEAAEALATIDSIDRRACRDYFDARFSVSAMAENYLHIYQNLAGRTGLTMRERLIDLERADYGFP
ncbi:MAG: glycosyltransferase family 4 protein, partial [Bdellovibrionia bacterium]